MALTLTVDGDALAAHVRATARAMPGLVPVVKGNGYGFGRPLAAMLTIELLQPEEVAVGTVHELRDVPSPPTRLVLTPALDHEVPLAAENDVLTVGHLHHVQALGRRSNPVLVKLRSHVHRYGATAEELPAVLDALATQERQVHGFGVHPALDGSAEDHADDVRRLLPLVPEGARCYVSHLDAVAYAGLRAERPDLEWRVRMGTLLWIGDRRHLHLEADVVQVVPVRAGERAGYRQVEVPGDGAVVLVSAGTAHGVHPLAGGRSPFHHARRRLALIEPPHMHTSMLWVADGEPCPAVGDPVDVQRPLSQVSPDRVIWRNPPMAHDDAVVP